MVWVLKVAYYLCPFLAIGSVVWYVVGDVGIWATIFFFVFGFLGMLAGTAARQLEGRRKNEFVFHTNDPFSIARAAFFEIEARGDVPGLILVKDEVLQLLNDRKKVTSSIVDDKMDPRGLIYLLISNVANAKLCSGNFHFYRGMLNTSGTQLLRAFEVTSQRMVAMGVHDQAAYEHDMASIRKEISEIG